MYLYIHAFVARLPFAPKEKIDYVDLLITFYSVESRLEQK